MGTSRRRRRIARTLAPLILPCIVSCGDAGPTGPTPTEGRPVEGEQEFTFEGATIRVPDRMIAIDPANHMDAALDDLKQRIGGEEGERLAKLVRDVVAQDAVEFFAFDPSTPGDGFAENVNVIIIPLPPGLDRAGVLAANVEQFRQIDMAILASDEFVAGELTFDRLRTRADRMGTEGQLYLLVRDGRIHAVTFTAAPSTADEFLGSSESIMRSYRVP